MSRGARLGVIALLLACLAGGLTALTAAPSAQAAPFAGQQQRPTTLAKIELAELSPRVVTAESPSVLRLRGRIVNVGDRPITKLGVRVQRDAPLRSDAAADNAVRGVPEAPHVTRFTPVPGTLAPGQSSAFELDVPLRGGGELESLQITEPGVYPLLVNLNGKPDYGGTARLASVPLLLPVLGLPPREPGAAPGAVASLPAQPTGLTVLWPLATDPVRLPSAPGEPLLIRADPSGTDPMATQLAPGGRLDGLLGALEQVVPPGSPLAGAVCVAIDPLLLETVDGMSRGYRVVSPAQTVDGTGARDARAWLDRLRAAVQGRCVLPLPYADADLVALSRAGLTDLGALATSTGVRLVEELLGVQPLRGVIWPAGGALDERTLADLGALETRAVLVEPDGLSPEQDPGSVVRLVGSAPGSASGVASALVTDPLITTALAPSEPVVDEERLADNDVIVAARPTGTGEPLAAQDGIGALIYRAVSDPGPRPVLLAPPRRWEANGREATELLRTAQQLLDAGFVAPQELSALLDKPVRAAAVAVRYPEQEAAAEVPPSVTAEAGQARDVLRDLQVSTVRDATANLEPAALLDPLRLGLLRGTSSAWRGAPEQAERATAEVRSALDELCGSVRIVPPPGPYTLAASDSPLVITVSNELPVGVQVRLNLSESPGLRSGAVGVQLVPARSTRQLVIPAEVVRAGQFSVGARLSTPGGTPLGQPGTLHLRSTAYGPVTVLLTAGAGAVLVLLVARRIIRRVRAARKAG